jgi:hypothetical protein
MSITSYFITENFHIGEITLNSRLEFRDINLIAGYNGAGKSAINKLIWVMQSTVNVYAVLLEIPEINRESDQRFKDTFIELLRGTFDDINDIHGAFKYQTDIYTLRLNLLPGGVVDYFDVDVHEPEKFNNEFVSAAMYCSQETRTFSQLDKYRKLVNKLGIDEIRDFYKVYDIIRFEHILKFLQDPEFKPELQKRFDRTLEILNKDGKENIKLVPGSFDIIDNVPWICTENTRIKMSNLSDGEQSIFMMGMFY